MGSRVGRSPYRLIPLLLCSLLACSCSTIRLGASAQAVPDDAFGLAHAGETEADYAFLSALGARWLRQTFKWGYVNPRRDEWNFDRFDSLMDLADAHGAKVMAVLAYDVGWIYPTGKSERNIGPELLPLYLEYVRRVVSRYRGRVDAWEIWNEPNWTFWKGPRSNFYDLAAQTAQLVKELDPETPLLVGATFRTDKAFIRKLYGRGAFAYADALSIHPYAVSPRGVSGQVLEAKALLKELSLDRQLWISEIGFPTQGLYPSKVSAERLPDYVIETLAIATSQGARVTIWYENLDAKAPGGFHPMEDSASSFGLGYAGGALKEGGRAFGIFAEGARGGIYDPSIVELDASLSASLYCAPYRDAAGDSALVVLWRRGGRDRPIRAHSEGASVRELYPASREPAADAEEWRGTIGRSPVILRFSGLRGAAIGIAP